MCSFPYLYFLLPSLTLRESDIRVLSGITPSECPVNKPTVASKRECARVEDPNFIATSKSQADVKFMVYMNSVERWRKSAKIMAGNRKGRTYTNHKSISDHEKPAGFCPDTDSRARWPSVEWNCSLQRAHCSRNWRCRILCLRRHHLLYWW